MPTLPLNFVIPGGGRGAFDPVERNEWSCLGFRFN